MIFTALHMQGVESSERMHARSGQGFADPWSDRRIAEFACQVPQRILNRVGEPKFLVRRALKTLIPEHHVQAMQKIVPTPLFDRGLLDRGQPLADGLIRDSMAARLGFLDRTKLHDAYQALCAGPAPGVATMWRALTLELWLRETLPPERTDPPGNADAA